MTPKAQDRQAILDWMVLIVIAPLILAGMLAVLLPRLPEGMRGSRSRISSGSLRDVLIGNSKQAIASMLGPPRTASVKDTAFPDSDTWYYVLDARQHSAVAIQFDGEIAREVEILRG